MKKIAIFGAGGFGREVKMLIDQINEKEKLYDLIGFYDEKVYEQPINGLPYLGGLDELNQTDFSISIAIAIGDPNTKRKVIERISNTYIDFPNLIHPSVLVGKDHVLVGKGNIICSGTILTVNICLGDFIILNLMCTVGHDTTIGSYSSFMPSVNISGEVNIAEGVYVGTGAKIINLLTIGENTIVGAGAVVSKDLPPYCTAVGIPAKPIKFHV